MTEPAESPRPPSDQAGDEFRWQSCFQRSSDALFLLNSRRRIVFVNRAWEALTGLSAREARGLVCRRRARDPGALWDELVQNALAPPAEVLASQSAEVRRLLPASEGRTEPQWWSIRFFPLAGGEAPVAILGRINVMPSEGIFANPPLPEKTIALRDRRAHEHSIERLQSDVPAMQRVVEQVRLAAGTRVPVLLVGEPGTGKHWLARLIHQQSAARHRAFARLDCGRLPVTVLEGMFGQLGPFRLPPAGTVYLREVTHLQRELQERLLRWLTSLVDDGPRLVTGLAADPQSELQAGHFLPELHCALSPLVIALPPLRDRLADLPRLVPHLLERASAAADHKVSGVNADAMDILRSCRWPGNLRELYQVLVSACGRAKGERLEAGDLPFYVRGTPAPTDRALALDSILEQVERRLIAMALKMAQNNKSRAAELLSIWRPRLLRRMEVLGIKDE